MSDQAAQLRGLVEALRPSNNERSVVSVMPQSVPTGAVSYGPAAPRPRSAVEAHAVHQRVSRPPAHRPIRLASAIAVASGKGGVGKSNLAVNLAVALSTRGLKVCLLDGDLGLANADVLCNLSPRLTLEQVVSARCRLADAMMLAPGGFQMIPGASGVARMADLNATQRRALLEQLVALERVADIIIIDCGAGINANVLGFAAAANTTLVVTTPEPTAITDGYGMIKSLTAEQSARSSAGMLRSHGSNIATESSSIQLVVNMASDQTEGAAVHHRISRVARTFLNLDLGYAGAIPVDPSVPAAVRQRLPFVLAYPNSPATAAVHRLASKLLGVTCSEDQSSQPNAGFFVRVLTWLGIVEVDESPTAAGNKSFSSCADAPA